MTLFLSDSLILKELLWQFSFNTSSESVNLDHFPAENDLIISFWFDLQKIWFYIFCHMKPNKCVPIIRLN